MHRAVLRRQRRMTETDDFLPPSHLITPQLIHWAVKKTDTDDLLPPSHLITPQLMHRAVKKTETDKPDADAGDDKKPPASGGGGDGDKPTDPPAALA